MVSVGWVLALGYKASGAGIHSQSPHHRIYRVRFVSILESLLGYLEGADLGGPGRDL